MSFLTKNTNFPCFVDMFYLPSNTPSSIFYGSIFWEFLGTAWCKLMLTDFVPKASPLYTRIKTSGGNKTSILCQMKIQLQKYLESTVKHIWQINQQNS